MMFLEARFCGTWTQVEDLNVISAKWPIEERREDFTLWPIHPKA